MVVVGEVDGGEGADTDADTDTVTSPGDCDWQVHEVGDALYGVWGASENAVYAVGGNVGDAPIALRYDGASWTDLDPPISYPLLGLRDVWGNAENNVWAIYHVMRVAWFDGGSWSHVDVITDALSGIWGTSSTDLFVVGGGLFPDGLILRYHEGSWVPMEGAEGTWLNAVWGSAENDVYAVGPELVIHFGGSQWSTVLGSISLSGVTLESVWGSSAADVYAVGWHWAGPVLLHFNGTQWEDVDVDTIASSAELRGVHGSGPDDVWVVGALQSNGIALRFDGEAWTEVDYTFPFPLNDVWVAPSGEVFTVGDQGVVYCTL